MELDGVDPFSVLHIHGARASNVTDISNTP